MMFSKTSSDRKATSQFSLTHRKEDSSVSSYSVDKSNLRWSRSRLSIVLICFIGFISYSRLVWMTKVQDQVVRDISEESGSNSPIYENGGYTTNKAKFGDNASRFAMKADRNHVQTYFEKKPKNPLTIHQDSSRECLSSWISRGELCKNVGVENTMPIDLVWTWQSQRHPGLAMSQAELYNVNESIYSASENDLLRYSIRSAQEHVQEGFGEIILLTPDVIIRSEQANIVNDDESDSDSVKGSHIRNSFNLLSRMRTILQDSLMRTNGTKLKYESEDNFVTTTQIEQLNIKSHQEIYVDEAGELHETIIPEWVEQKDKTLPFRIESLWSVACPHPKLESRSAEVNQLGKVGLSGKIDKIKSFMRLKSFRGGKEANAWTLVASYACKQKRLPTFNPAVVRQIASEYNGENSLYLMIEPNHLFGSDVSSSDFYSPVYGPVLRLSEKRTDEFKGEEEKIVDDKLYHRQVATEKANKLIGSRFGHRGRHKLSNAPTVVVRDLMDEMQQSWKQELRLASANKIPKTGDIDVLFLYVHFIIERYREALLWSFFIARHDVTGLNRYSQHDLKRILGDLDVPLDFLSAGDNKGHQVYFSDQSRSPIAEDGKNRYLDHHSTSKSFLPKLADITMTSQAGYVANFDRGKVGGNGERRACTLQKECLRPVIQSIKEGKPVIPTDLFRHISFNHWGCGDCVITHLLNKPGLTGFLPPKDLQLVRDSSYSHTQTQGEVKLPNKSRFEELDFSLHHVASQSILKSNSRFSFVTDLLLRYQHAISIQAENRDSIVLDDTLSEKNVLLELERHSLALFSIIIKATQAYQSTRRVLFAWLNLHYPDVVVFERVKS